jgi:peptidoglycan/LPS O-acetylase OafA/YrhL
MLLNFRRITTGASWIPQVDGLRFVAIVSVLLMHTLLLVRDEGARRLIFPNGSRILTFAIENGDRGVCLFFVISGYILARPFLREHRLGGHKVSLSAYFLRRVTRLEPPYILSLLLFVPAVRIARHASLGSLLPHLGASLVYLHSLIFRGPSTISGVTWSLEVEIQFYILAPLLGNLYRVENTVLRRSLLLALVFAAAGISIVAGGFYGQWTILGFGQYFLMGFLLADILEFPRHSDRTWWAWDVLSLVLWPTMFMARGTPAIAAWLPVAIGLAFLGAFHGKAFNWFFRQPAIALTGGMCYSIYLMHLLFILSAYRWVGHLRLWGDGTTALLQMFLLISLGLVGSAFYFLLIERPCMDPKWPQKLYKSLFRSRAQTQPV